VTEREFTVPGVPVPQGSKRIGAHGQMYDQAGARLKAWRSEVATMAMLNRKHYRFEKECGVDLVFRVKRDADLDKLTRAVFDGLQEGGLLVDDKLVVFLSAEKQRSLDTGVDVRIYTVED